MPNSSALRFKSGKGKSVRIDKIRAQKQDILKAKINHVGSIIFSFFIFIISITFLSLFVFYKKLNENFVSAESYGTYNSDITSFSYIVVDSFKSDPIQLKKLNFIVLDKNSNKTLIFDIPLDVEFNLPGKYSDMSLNKTFALGALNSEDKLKGGVELLNTTLFKIFGISVDNYILVEDNLSTDVNQLLYEGKSIFPFGGLGITRMRNSFDTNFSFKSFYQTQKFLSSVEKESFIKTNLSKEQITNTFFIDGIFEDISLSSAIASEKKTVSVLNGTDFQGIATLGSRVIKNRGGRVVSIENALDKYTNSVLIVDSPDSKTVSYIKKAFNIDKVYTKEEAPFVKESSVDRSDITLILGFDLASKIY